ncbi:TIM23 translocase complex subunit Tim21 [Schizosaccharomyces japonicus yFS275]|uniref:Mitochondrial import inner membrane translocase subunit Tim21 n=1 Tax=Schizosaccharomyces japonicus (strain yFS275 / FY16936) TaxID=402676 RepID=B6JXY2_SCHJY|nr:TIM23 translocase complex subunit Tim21 [Schizosaccharomyces japonicus yFS275]EEB06400.1 TIM23 translocase complex subunit Tim21 [Schizosaccharomyces japonicus yFS275]
MLAFQRAATLPVVQPIKAHIRLYSLASDAVKNSRTRPEGRLARIFKDSPDKKWKELTIPQKMYRASSTAGNAAIFALGASVFGLIAYSLVTSMTGGEAYFGDDAFEKVRKHPECEYAIGESMKAIGEGTHPLRRSHGVLSTRVYDPSGREFMLLQFHVIGNKSKGHVFGRLVKKGKKFEWDYLYVDVSNYGNIILFDNSNSLRQLRKKVGLWGSFKNISWGS